MTSDNHKDHKVITFHKPARNVILTRPKLQWHGLDIDFSNITIPDHHFYVFHVHFHLSTRSHQSFTFVHHCGDSSRKIYTARSKGYVQLLECQCVIWIYQPPNTDDLIVYAHQPHGFTSEKIHKIGCIRGCNDSFSCAYSPKEYYRNVGKIYCNHFNYLFMSIKSSDIYEKFTRI